MADPLTEAPALAGYAKQRHPVPLDQPEPEHGAANDSGLLGHNRLDQRQRLAHQPAMLLGADGIKIGRPHEGLDLFRIALQHQKILFADLAGLGKAVQALALPGQPQDRHVVLVGNRVEIPH